MAEPLKNMYSRALLAELAASLKKNYAAFDSKKFLEAVFDAEWEKRELKSRMRHISVCCHRFLPFAYEKQIAVLRKVAPQFNGFIAIVFPDFVEVFGLDEPDISIPALELFTQYSSSEFAVRPYIMRYEKRMVKQHLQWAKHANHHVRRLASEGIRPRLPWAMALPQFKKDPSAILPILELLKKDSSDYVRRSVANNLNDISKDHPGVVIDVLARWKNISPETDWILRHASRGLLKKGHTEALSSFGISHTIKAEVSGFTLSAQKIKIGDSITMKFDVKLTEKKAQQVRVEYKVYYMKSNGSHSAKVFQVGTYNMKPGAVMSITKKHSFEERTTRKHYPGEHKIAVVINGKEKAVKAIDLAGRRK